MAGLAAEHVNDVGTSTRVRQWYVSSPHRTVIRASGDHVEMPFGVAHVRKVGAPLTACGRPAMNWPIFWLLTVADAGEMCAECKWTARLEGTDPTLQAKG